MYLMFNSESFHPEISAVLDSAQIITRMRQVVKPARSGTMLAFTYLGHRKLMSCVQCLGKLQSKGEQTDTQFVLGTNNSVGGCRLSPPG